MTKDKEKELWKDVFLLFLHKNFHVVDAAEKADKAVDAFINKVG